MTRAVFEAEMAFASQPLVAAIVICRAGDNLHSGLLYLDTNSAVRVLHLGWQDRLYNSWGWPRLWAAPDVEPERLASVAALCRLIWEDYEAKKKFPYGLKFLQTSFSPNGQLLLGPGAKGLTCATFVLAVFNSFGIQIVNESDWPVRQDEDRRFLDRMRPHMDPGHFALLEAEISEGCRRIRPEEVVGACSCHLPALFVPSREAGDEVIRLLDAGPRPA